MKITFPVWRIICNMVVCYYNFLLFKVHMTQNIFPNCYASLESTFKMMKNGLNNLFTAHNFTIIVLRWQQKEEYLISLK
jgi:hypothetical protein